MSVLLLLGLKQGVSLMRPATGVIGAPIELESPIEG
jgi:hypothetical protein